MESVSKIITTTVDLRRKPFFSQKERTIITTKYLYRMMLQIRMKTFSIRHLSRNPISPKSDIIQTTQHHFQKKNFHSLARTKILKVIFKSTFQLAFELLIKIAKNLKINGYLEQFRKDN